MSKRVLLLIVLLSATTTLTNCGELAPTGASAGTAAKKEVRVAIVPPGFISPFHVAIRDGAIDAASKLGWIADVVAAEKEGDFAGQVALVEQEIQKGVAAIAVNPIDLKAVVSAVKKANKANIPVFMQNTITPVDAGQVVEYIGYDQWAGAAKLAEYACRTLNNYGHIYILTGIPGFQSDRRTQGFKWGLQQHCPNVQVVGEQTAEWEREKAVNVATAALQQHPEINLFYGNSDEMGIGACIAAKKLGRSINKDIWCLSIDGNDVTLDLIEKGDITATLGVYPKMMGALVVIQMRKQLNGEKIPYILETPSLVVDKSNIADYKAGKTWIEPNEGRPEFDNGRPTGET